MFRQACNGVWLSEAEVIGHTKLYGIARHTLRYRTKQKEVHDVVQDDTFVREAVAIRSQH